MRCVQAFTLTLAIALSANSRQASTVFSVRLLPRFHWLKRKSRSPLFIYWIDISSPPFVHCIETRKITDLTGVTRWPSMLHPCCSSQNLTYIDLLFVTTRVLAYILRSHWLCRYWLCWHSCARTAVSMPQSLLPDHPHLSNVSSLNRSFSGLTGHD